MQGDEDSGRRSPKERGLTLDNRISLIRPGVTATHGAWADLGCGAGAFTAALASLLQSGSVIHAVDRDRRALATLEQELAGPSRRPGSTDVRITCIPGDFTRQVVLPPLDGVLIANALHFHRDACAVLARVGRWLKPAAVLIVVEYDVRRASPWVPHPLPWERFEETASCAGLRGVRLLGTRPSAYHQSMYAAACSFASAPLAQTGSGR